MLSIATDWATISSLATGVGTLVLAIATFAAVLSARRSNRVAQETLQEQRRSAQAAEAALQEQRRPIFTQSRFDDPVQKINFVEGHWVKAAGGRAVAEHVDGIVYLAISLRNVGSGIGVCQRWVVRRSRGVSSDMPTHVPEEDFRSQSRDLYMPPGDVGMWQGALRNPHDPARARIAEAIDAREPITIELLYSDLVGGQRTITRFGLTAFDAGWIATMIRHWYLDWTGPRPERDLTEAQAAVMRDQEEAERERDAGAARDDGIAARDDAVDGDGAPAASDDGQAQELPAPGRIE
ncbi:MAG: hypothetical protein ACTHQQ_00585 [Solirubrobacteraceae bacterium]